MLGAEIVIVEQNENAEPVTVVHPYAPGLGIDGLPDFAGVGNTPIIQGTYLGVNDFKNQSPGFERPQTSYSKSSLREAPEEEGLYSPQL
jgi:hypothetical protein